MKPPLCAAVPILTAAALLAWQQPSFRATVPVVMTSVTVTDRSGKHINGLEAADFVLLDDGAPRTFQLDTADTVAFPVALVVAVQANNTAPAALRKIQKIGSMIEPLITGERGHAAVVAFASSIDVVQDFTADAGEITAAFRRIKPNGGKQARTLDAVVEAVALLAARKPDERRILIVISESRDRGSNARIDEAVAAAQRAGVAISSAVFSAFATPFTAKPGDLPSSGGFDPIAAITEPARLAKVNAAEALARLTGGRRLSFATLRGLESAVTGLGEEIHSQYILTYTAADCRPGFHRLEVRVRNHPDAIVRARAGYYTSADSCGSGPTGPGPG